MNELREALEMSEAVSPEQVAAEAVAQLRILRAEIAEQDEMIRAMSGAVPSCHPEMLYHSSPHRGCVLR